MKKYILVIYLELITILLLQIFYVYTQNSLVTRGQDLAATNEELGKYKRENIVLHNELLHLQSLMYISEEARKQGFVPAQYIYFKYDNTSIFTN